MPYKFETQKMKMKIEDKKNVKLMPQDKEEIRKLYSLGSYSQRELARMYNVSRRSIVFAIYPEKYEIAQQQLKQRQKEGKYYHKEKQREYISNLRKHKKELYLQGKLLEVNDE